MSLWSVFSKIWSLRFTFVKQLTPDAELKKNVHLCTNQQRALVLLKKKKLLVLSQSLVNCRFRQSLFSFFFFLNTSDMPSFNFSLLSSLSPCSCCPPLLCPLLTLSLSPLFSLSFLPHSLSLSLVKTALEIVYHYCQIGTGKGLLLWLTGASVKIWTPALSVPILAKLAPTSPLITLIYHRNLFVKMLYHKDACIIKPQKNNPLWSIHHSGGEPKSLFHSRSSYNSESTFL